VVPRETSPTIVKLQFIRRMTFDQGNCLSEGFANRTVLRVQNADNPPTGYLRASFGRSATIKELLLLVPSGRRVPRSRGSEGVGASFLYEIDKGVC
jgi:hypothetical protein